MGTKCRRTEWVAPLSYCGDRRHEYKISVGKLEMKRHFGKYRRRKNACEGAEEINLTCVRLGFVDRLLATLWWDSSIRTTPSIINTPARLKSRTAQSCLLKIHWHKTDKYRTRDRRKYTSISLRKFYVHVTVHHNKLLCNKTILYSLISQIYFVMELLHVSDSSSVYHQEFIHCTLSNGMCHTGL